MSGPEPPRAFVIFNPASGRGAGARRMPEYLALLERHLGTFEHGVTEGAGDEARLADAALAAGHRLIVAVGGDGTWSHVADRIVASGRSDVRFGILPAGTGNDLVKGIPGRFDDPETAVRALSGEGWLPVDMGELIVLREDGTRSSPRNFTLLFGIGIDVAIIRSVMAARFLRGPLVYHAAAVTNLFRHVAADVRYSDGGRHAGDGKHLLLAVCNGAIVGGGFHLAPGAKLTDGRLDLRAVRDGGVLERARTLMRVERGRGDASPLVSGGPIERLELRLETPQPYQVDGELQAERILGADIRVLPGALRVVVPEVPDPEP